MRLILFLVLILLTSTTLAAAQLAGNCSSASEIVLRRSGAEYVIQGSKVAAYPLRSDTGERLPNVSLQWDLTLLIERGKTWRWDRDSSAFAAEYISPDPNTPATLIRKALGLPCNDTKEPCYVDPFHVTNELTEIDCPGTRGACGPVLQHFSTSSLNCYQRRVINESFYGTRRESVITTFSLPGDRSTLGDAADFRFIAENHLVDDYVSYWGDSDGLQEHYVYEPQQLKLSYEIINWPWAGEDFDVPPGSTWNNASGIDLWANLTLDIGMESRVSIAKTTRNKTIDFVAMDGRLKIRTYTSAVIILDNLGIGLNESSAGVSPATNVPPISASAQMRWTVASGSVGHWKRMTYDPTLATLLTSDMSPNSSNRSKTIGLAVGLTIAAVVIITGAIILAFLFSPKVRKAIAPYSQRKDQPETSNVSNPAVLLNSESHSWTQGTTPQ